MYKSVRIDILIFNMCDMSALSEMKSAYNFFPISQYSMHGQYLMLEWQFLLVPAVPWCRYNRKYTARFSHSFVCTCASWSVVLWLAPIGGSKSFGKVLKLETDPTLALPYTKVHLKKFKPHFKFLVYFLFNKSNSISYSSFLTANSTRNSECTMMQADKWQ